MVLATKKLGHLTISFPVGMSDKMCQKLCNLFMVLMDGQILRQACKYNLNLVGKWVGEHQATTFPVGMSLYPGQHWEYAASFTIILNLSACLPSPPRHWANRAQLFRV